MYWNLIKCEKLNMNERNFYRETFEQMVTVIAIELGNSTCK